MPPGFSAHFKGLSSCTGTSSASHKEGGGCKGNSLEKSLLHVSRKEKTVICVFGGLAQRCDSDVSNASGLCVCASVWTG